MTSYQRDWTRQHTLEWHPFSIQISNWARAGRHRKNSSLRSDTLILLDLLLNCHCWSHHGADGALEGIAGKKYTIINSLWLYDTMKLYHNGLSPVGYQATAWMNKLCDLWTIAPLRTNCSEIWKNTVLSNLSACNKILLGASYFTSNTQQLHNICWRYDWKWSSTAVTCHWVSPN